MKSCDIVYAPPMGDCYIDAAERLANTAVNRYIDRHGIDVDPDSPHATWDLLWERHKRDPNHNPAKLGARQFAAWVDGQ